LTIHWVNYNSKDNIFVSGDQEEGLGRDTRNPHSLANADDVGFIELAHFCYSAGSSILRMIQAVMGDHFQKAMHYYLETNAYGNVNSQTLIDALSLYIRKAEIRGRFSSKQQYID